MRTYTLPSGLTVPSVTTVLDVVHKPKLEAWKLRVGAEEAERQRREAAEFGIAVHKMCETGEVAPGLEPWYDAFMNWEDAAGEMVYAEKTVSSERHRYAGTLDLVISDRQDNWTLVDIKTGSVVDPMHGWQLEAYCRAFEEQELKEINRRVVLHMPRKRPGHLEVIEFTDDAGDWRCFLACLVLWWRLHGESKEVK